MRSINISCITLLLTLFTVVWGEWDLISSKNDELKTRDSFLGLSEVEQIHVFHILHNGEEKYIGAPYKTNNNRQAFFKYRDVTSFFYLAEIQYERTGRFYNSLKPFEREEILNSPRTQVIWDDIVRLSNKSGHKGEKIDDI